MDTRKGLKWMEEEDLKLKEEVLNDPNKDYLKIAEEHKRTLNAILLRVISHLIYPKYKENNQINMDEISDEFKIEKDMIIRNISKLNEGRKKEINENKKEKSKLDLIMEKLDLILEKLNKIDLKN